MAMTTIIIPEAPPRVSGGAGQARELRAGGLRLALLDNSKGNADHLLAFIGEGLRAAMPGVSVKSWRKPTASMPAREEVLDDITREADCVVSAMAD